MATIFYQCDRCHTVLTLATGELHSIPFNRMPQLVLEADRHRCSKKEKR